MTNKVSNAKNDLRFLVPAEPRLLSLWKSLVALFSVPQKGRLPPIYNALRITSEGFDVPNPISVIAEVEQHLGEGRVKAVAMEATEGMVDRKSVV